MPGRQFGIAGSGGAVWNESATLKSAVPFLDSRSHVPVDALGGASVVVSSAELGWSGVVVEAGSKDSWEVDDLTIAHHYLALNVDEIPLIVEVKGPRGFRRVVLEPGSVWVCPAGDPFTHRVRAPCSYALVSIEPEHFGRLLGEPATRHELRRDYNIKSPQMEHLVKALVAEADRRNPSGLPFVEALVTALSLQLVQHVGVHAPIPEPARGGLSATARRRVLELIDAQLADGVSVAELAREAGLSPTHFARAFKQSVGRAPHQYLLAARLERARRMLDIPEASLSDVALRTGFADQAHFTRLFKRRFGVTPGAVLRRRR
jgi:AraC family transcriptional regulator